MRGATVVTFGVAWLTPESTTGWVLRVPSRVGVKQQQQQQQRQQQRCRRMASRQQPLPWATRSRSMTTMTMTASPLPPIAINSPNNSPTRQKRLSCAPNASARVDARSKAATAPRPRGKDVRSGTADAKGAAKAAAAMRGSTSGPDKGLDDVKTEPWMARLTLVIVACLYGTNYAAIKFMGGFLETSSMLALRFGLASLAFLPALRGVEKAVLLAGAEVGVYATLGYWSQAWAMRYLPASQIALVGCLAVLVVPFLDHLSGRRKAGVSTMCAAMLACGGAAVLQSGGMEAGVGDDAGILPHAMALLQPLFFGMSTWRMEAHASRHPGQALPLTAGQVLVVALSSFLWCMLDGGFPSGIPEALTHPFTDPMALIVLVWLGLVNTSLVLFLETNALESVSASEATVIYSLEPLVGAGLASSVLGEPFGPSTALGASLVLGGCLCSSVGTGGDESQLTP